MGYRQQLFVVAKLGDQYRSLAIVHHQVRIAMGNMLSIPKTSTYVFDAMLSLHATLTI